MQEKLTGFCGMSKLELGGKSSFPISQPTQVVRCTESANGNAAGLHGNVRMYTWRQPVACSA